MMMRNEKKKNREVSLNEPIGVDKEGNSISLMDVVEENNTDILERIETDEDIILVRKFVNSKLTKREREIINMRYGMNGTREKTQKVIGREMGISRSYVSRIEKKALEKLKKAFDIT